MKKVKINKINKRYNNKYSKNFYNFAVKDNENYFVNRVLTHNCYSSRYNPDTIYVSTNQDQIINECIAWSKDQVWPKIPNQQDSTYYMVDIGNHVDMSLMQKHLTKSKVNNLFSTNTSGLEYILKRFDETEKLNTTFATKYSHMLKLDVNNFNKKPRVRISIMPKTPMKVLEPNTTDLETRISDIERLEKLGWEVHINFAPIVIYNGWTKDYEKLINRIPPRPCEVIFLTNHVNSMSRASNKAKEFMKYSNEVKNKSGVMRYPIKGKRKAVSFIKNLLESKGFTVRYIF